MNLIKAWRELTIVILIAISALSVSTCRSKHELNNHLLHVNDSAFKVARIYYNKHGELVQQVFVQELTIRDLKKMAESMGTDKEELKEQVGNLKNLVGYWKGKVGFKGRDSIRFKDSTRIVEVKGVLDTIDFKTFDWTNGHLSLHEDYYPNDDTVALEYKYDIGEFDLTVYRKKKGFLKKKQLVADLKFGDPNMKVSKFEGVLVKEDKKLLKWWHWLLIGFGGGIVVDKLN